MFTDKEIELLKSLYIDLDYNDLSDDDLLYIEEKVSEAFQYRGIGPHDRVTKYGRICESILDKVTIL